MDPDTSYVQRTEDEAFPPLPPPHSPGRGGREDREPFGNEEEDDEGNVSKLDEVPAAKRKGVKRPQPKLDSQRLISERGLPALRTMFDDVHFKGKGHEAADLRLLMQKMENWAHRLFPKLQFEDFIDKVEKLGNKKEVQTCLKRIRLDMPRNHEDFNEGEEEAAAPLPLCEDPDPFSGVSFSNEVQRHVHSTPAPAAPSPAAPPSLSEEQQRRMELNRQRALERRLARHHQQEADSTHSQAGDTSSHQPASVSSANVLNTSKDDEEVTERLDLEPDGSSTPPTSQTPPTNPPSQTPPTNPPSLTQPTNPPSLTPPTNPPSQTPPTDPEASAESSQHEDETSQQPISNEPEDTD